MGRSKKRQSQTLLSDFQWQGKKQWVQIKIQEIQMQHQEKK